MENFGIFLKAHREKKGIRLEEIASITKIHIHNLQLLETNQLDHLPPEPFIRGFIIAYAKYVGLDPKETVARYSQQLKDQQLPLVEPDKPEPSEPVKNPEQVMERVHVNSMWKIAGIGLSLLIIVGIAFITYIGKKSTDRSLQTSEAPIDSGTSPNESVPQDSVEKRENSSASDDSNIDLADATPAPTLSPLEEKVSGSTAGGNTGHEIKIEGNERTWVKIVKDDERAEETFLLKGQSLTASAQSKIKVVLGNATLNKVFHNGKQVDGVKYSGTIRIYAFPPDAKFPLDAPSDRAISSKVTDRVAVPKTNTQSPAPKPRDTESSESSSAKEN